MKRLITETFTFDIRQLARENLLLRWSTFERVWRQDRGRQQASVRILVEEEALQITYPQGALLTQQRIQLTYSIGHRGGKRPWFLCPSCQQRTAILYYEVGCPFRCRRCSHLVYPSQYPSQDRSYSRQHRCLTHRAKTRILTQTAAVQENRGLAGAMEKEMRRVL